MSYLEELEYMIELKRVPTDDKADDYSAGTADTKEEAPDDTTSTTPAPEETEPDESEKEETPEEEKSSDDYTIDDKDKEEEEEESDDTEEEEKDDTEESDEPASDTEESIGIEDDTEEDSEIKNLENEVYKDLDIVQKNIRDSELIRLYVQMYDIIIKTLDDIDNIPKNEKTISILQFSSKKLLEVRNIIHDYIVDTYKTKTYIENMITYYEFVSTVNSIANLIDKLKDEEDEDKK